MANYTMEEIKQIIRSIAISGSTSDMPVKQLVQDFKKMEGFDLPYQRLGFRSADDFLRSLPDTVKVHGYGTTAVIEPVVTKSNQHIRNMIQLSKVNSRRRPLKNNYGYRKSSAKYRDNDFTNRKFNNNSVSNTMDEAEHDTTRRIVNKEYDYLDNTENFESDSSDEGPKFAVTIDKKLTQIENAMDKMKIASPSRSKEAIPDNVLRLINSVGTPEDALSLSDVIHSATIPKEILPKETVRIFVSEVHNPNRIWFHFKENADMIANLMNELELFYSSLEEDEWCLKPSNVVVGLYCAVYFLGMWHRAKIVEDIKNNKIKVFFIDYGTVSLVELRDVKFLAKSFHKMQAQAMRASLAYVKPIGNWWTHEAAWELLSLVREKILHAYVVDVEKEDNIMSVVLVDNTKTKNRVINQQLSLKGYASWEQDQSYEDNSTETFRCRTKSFWELFPSFEDLENGEYPTLAELARSLSTGFNFEHHFIMSLYEDDIYFEHIRTKPVTVDSKAIENTNSKRCDRCKNLRKEKDSNPFEDDDGLHASNVDESSASSTVYANYGLTLVPQSIIKDSRKTPAILPDFKKQVKFLDPVFAYIPNNSR